MRGGERANNRPMGYQDRRYNDSGEGGGFRRALRRIFVEGTDFFSWSFPLMTVPRKVPWIGGIRVRVHLLFVLMIAGELIGSLRPDAIGLLHSLPAVVMLFVLVLLHEFGHCAACRAVGGEADDILMWPLGGLAFCRPPHRWGPALITTLGGPGVNFALMFVLGGALLAVGAPPGTLYGNPFAPQLIIGDQWFVSAWARWLWWAYYVNFALLAFNMLLPMFPMDCGRVVQEVLWWRIGYRRATLIAVNLGLAIAIVLGVMAITPAFNGNRQMLGLAIFGGFYCYSEKRRLATTEEDEWFDTELGCRGLKGSAGESVRAADKAYKAALKRQERQRATQAEVDRILDKIRDQGMGSLTRKEKAILKDATERQRSAG